MVPMLKTKSLLIGILGTHGSTGARSWNELARLDYMTGYKDMIITHVIFAGRHVPSHRISACLTTHMESIFIDMHWYAFLGYYQQDMHWYAFLRMTSTKHALVCIPWDDINKTCIGMHSLGWHQQDMYWYAFLGMTSTRLALVCIPWDDINKTCIGMHSLGWH